MNTILAWAMGISAIIVTLVGGVLLAVLLFYGMYRLIAAIWERTSNAARHTKEYLRCRDDFDLYKRDVEVWDERRRSCIEKCQRCEYRRKAMEEPDHGKNGV